MAVRKQTEPRCIEVSVQRGAGGKVAIKEYGKISSDWHLSFSRRYEMPADWTQEQIDEFQITEHDRLFELIDPLDQASFDARYEQRDWD